MDGFDEGRKLTDVRSSVLMKRDAISNPGVCAELLMMMRIHFIQV